MSALNGGYEEGTPLTDNLMEPIPGLKEPPTPQHALARGAQTAAHHRTGVEGLDMRNYRRTHWTGKSNRIK